MCREYLTDNEMLHGYKIRDAFGTNPISKKRDYTALALERDGYVIPDGGGLREVGF